MISVSRFTTSAQEIAQQAAGIMQRYGDHQVDTEHVLLALLEQPGGISQLLEFLEVDPNALSEGLDAILCASPGGEIIELGPGQVSITPRVERIIELADEDARRGTMSLFPRSTYSWGSSMSRIRHLPVSCRRPA